MTQVRDWKLVCAGSHGNGRLSRVVVVSFDFEGQTQPLENWAVIDDHETEESVLQVVVTSGAEFATVVVEEHDETGSTTEEHHEMALVITGLSAGTTNFSLSLMHGDHADYQSTVDVVVTVTSGS